MATAARNGKNEQENATRSPLSAKQYAVISALLRGRTQVQAAREAGAAESTVSRWMDDEHFIAEYRQLREEVFSREREHMLNLRFKGVTTLVALMDGHMVRDELQFEIAKYVLDRTDPLSAPPDVFANDAFADDVFDRTDEQGEHA